MLTREAVLAEGVTGGFSTLYPVLKAFEESGRVRRGYFVSGLGGSQFAQPGALDRLRALRETAADPAAPDDAPPAVVLAATDPANAYGAALPWPADIKAMRAAGAHVVLVDGAMAAYLPRGEGELVARLPEDEPQRSRTAQAIAASARGLGAADGAGVAGVEEDRRRRRRRHRRRVARGRVRCLRAWVSVHGAFRGESERK